MRDSKDPFVKVSAWTTQSINKEQKNTYPKLKLKNKATQINEGIEDIVQRTFTQ